MSSGDDIETVTERVEPGTDPVRGLATALLMALRTIATYPAAHPRVKSSLAGMLAALRAMRGGDGWITLRLRGMQLGVDDEWLEPDDPQLEWLCERLRSASLCGIEFGPDCQESDILEFARAMAPGALRPGQASGPLWPTDHPSLRTLDLVFAGNHVEGEVPNAAMPVGRSATLRSSSVDAKRHRLITCMGASEALQRQLATIEDGCKGISSEGFVDVDLLSVIADLLPAEVTIDEAKIVQFTGEILDRVYAEVLSAARNDLRVEGSSLINTAIAIAKRYMAIEIPQQLPRKDLPAGRPEDEKIEASLELLLAEYAALPDPPSPAAGGALGKAVPGAPSGAEMLGIQLHTLAQAPPTEIASSLPAQLSELLDLLDAERLAVLDAYLLPAASDVPTSVGDAVTLRLLAVLTRIGRRPLILQRGYCPATLVRRAFPQSLPIAARILGGTPRGIAVMREAIGLLGPSLKAGGVDAAAAAGVLADTDVIRTLVAVGGTPPLPLLARAAAGAHGDVRTVIHEYARTLHLPGAVGSVVRWVALTDLPPDFLATSLQAAVAGAFDPKLQATAGSVLRDFIDRRRRSLPLEHLLGAIDSLRAAGGALTTEFLRRLATEGRWTSWGKADRAVRRRARQLLVIAESQSLRPK